MGFADSDLAYRNLDATANILGLLGGLYVASRCYHWINGARATAATPAGTATDATSTAQ
jgi:hypothetical protein